MCGGKGVVCADECMMCGGCECGEGMECGGESVVREWSVEVRVW